MAMLGLVCQKGKLFEITKMYPEKTLETWRTENRSARHAPIASKG